MTAFPPNRVDTTLASAGTGKTTTLVTLLARFLDEGVPPDRIVATTFTRRAAEELLERSRAHLTERGRDDDATALLGARIGTVNAVCGRLVEDFAFELGRAPGGEVVAEDGAAVLFAAAADEVLARYAPEMNGLAERFGLADQGIDWRDCVRRVIELTRANGLDAAGLARSADRSATSLLSLLPAAAHGASARTLDAALDGELRAALAALDGASPKATSADAAAAVGAAAGFLARGERPPWPLWAKLGKARAAKADAHVFAGVSRAALAHPSHPALARDLDRFVRLVFDCGAAAMAAFRSYKAERGLLDFADQETLALDLLRRPEARERLGERVEIVLVDEVQDASPLQVALFTALAGVARRSVWVGDPKQAIYGFRNADAALTLAATRGIAAGTGGTSGVLSTSWRSRPGICEFVNDAFLPAFERMGLPAEASRFETCARDDAGFAQPPLTAWHVTGSGRKDHAASLAGGVAALLADPSSWPVRPPGGGPPRGVRAGDVAVLCRGNADVEMVAAALAALAVPVAVERGDLLSMPEVELVLAALRWTADGEDRLSLAEMGRLVGGEERPTAWLEALGAADPDASLRALVPFAATLEGLRDRQLSMTPCEAVDATVLATGVVDHVCRWGSAAERLRALEAFRGVASRYEEECARLRLPATLGGLVAWLATRKVPRPAGGGDAVGVMTYHKAKGLEWPVVVLAQLEGGPRPRLFAPTAEVDGEVDWREPLARRWIRFWPWPYGAQSSGVGLDAAAAASGKGRAASREARDEAVRLLYVGMTRARDHLVLSRTFRPAGWLAALDTGDEPHVVLPAMEDRPARAGTARHPARFQLLAPAGRSLPARSDPLFLAPARPARPHRPLRLRPSGAVAAPARVGPPSRVDLGGRLPIVGSPDMGALGQAVHAFLGADGAGRDGAVRLARARATLDRWGVSGHFAAASLVEASDRLRSFLDRRFPGAELRREVPVFAPFGSQVVVGRVDLLVRLGDRFAVVDHKGLPGRGTSWDAKALAAIPQLDAYARAVALATGGSCEGLLVHMPLAGVVVEAAVAPVPVPWTP